MGNTAGTNYQDRKQDIINNDKILKENLDKNFVQRIANPMVFNEIHNKDGTRSTHRMETAENSLGTIAYPTIIQDKKTGELIDMSAIPYSDRAAYDYAMKTGEYIPFKDRQVAENWAEGGYKKGWKQ